ncbi:MAG: UDP-N-acetylglucosamine 2-epimerase (non-hydrolyzing) [Halioglobus sp.]
MKILTILGARPQFIKAATVSRAIVGHNESNKDEIREVIVHTGQHFDANMSGVFFEEMGIPSPNYNLGIASLGHGSMTGRMLEGIENIIHREKPYSVLVYGDTNSTLAGALAASKLGVPVVHVEAGLRSKNMSMPEEINRVLTDRVSSLLLCPTSIAIDNLKLEGYPFPTVGKSPQEMARIGDVMYDATLHYRERAKQTVALEKWGLIDKEFCLCTLHRAENTNNSERLDSIFKALRKISHSIPVVLPLHPRTHNLIEKFGRREWLEGLVILEPVSYLEMQRLEMGAHSILTDSGGVQKEAYFHRVPCITLRDETEWVETVQMGWNYIVGSDTDKILAAFHKVGEFTDCAQNPYGDGMAAQRVPQLICNLK